jgi:hypothetical protein
MSKNLGYFLFVLAVFLGPIIFWAIGPLLFWPLARQFLPPEDKRTGYFKNIFFLNLVFVIGVSLAIGLAMLLGVQDIIHLLAIPYATGVVFLIAGIVIFFVGRPPKK